LSVYLEVKISIFCNGFKVIILGIIHNRMGAPSDSG